MRHFVRFCILFACAAAARAGDLTIEVGGRAYVLPAETPIVVDEAPAVLSSMLHRPDGQQARWVFDGARGDGVHGGAGTLVFTYTVIGPVTSTEPLAVLGQPVTVTADTVLSGVADPAAIPVGSPLVVAGLVDANGSLLATVIEQRGAPGNKFLLSGYVSAVASATQFSIGAQPIDSTGQTFTDCAGGVPTIGDYIEVRANAVANFPPGSVLGNVFDIRCAQPVPFGTIGAEGFMQSIITAVPTDTTFTFGDLVIAFDDTTEFAFGSADDLEPGIAVAVDGAFTDATHFLAEAVEFVRPTVRFIVPVSPAQVVPGESISPFGIPVYWNAQVRDDDDYLASGMTTTRQVEVRAYLDGAGRAFATRVRDRGAAALNDVRLRGPVTAIDPPRMTVQGRTIDTTTSAYFDMTEKPTTAEAFFAAVQLGDIVDISVGVYDAATQTVSGGDVTHVAPEPVPPPPAIPTPGLRAGTARYALPDAVFKHSFE